MLRTIIFTTAMCTVGVLLASCDSGSDDLLPYEGGRPLTFLKITQSYAPDIQWVGGRVAAVGVNRGSVPGFDNTLVWLMTAGDDEISSHATVGENSDEARILSLGGVPLDSLEDGVEYTFWLATKEGVDAGLDTTLSEHLLEDTTFTLGYELRGRLRTQDDIDVAAFRDQKLTLDRIVLRWTPADFEFRRIALTTNSSPGWANLIWHVETPSGTAPNLKSPAISTEPPAGAEIIVPWPEEGLVVGGTYTLWMTTDNWNGTFGIRTNGLSYIQVFTNSILQ
jgi:hypothetical protein